MERFCLNVGLVTPSRGAACVLLIVKQFVRFFETIYEIYIHLSRGKYTSKYIFIKEELQGSSFIFGENLIVSGDLSVSISFSTGHVENTLFPVPNYDDSSKIN